MKYILETRPASLVLGLSSLAFVSLLSVGCGSSHNFGDTEGRIVIPAIKGTMHGGQQPVYGATIQLWAVGMPLTGGGYGSGQTALILDTVTTDRGGQFSITNDYTCPTDGYVYITGTGGQPTANGTSNSGLAMMAALGACSNLSASTFININEATTVAGVWALQQFATATFGTPGTFSVGAPSTNITGLQNAFAGTNNIADSSTGAIPLTTTVSGTVNSQPVAVTVLNEQTKVGTLANILASCVNSTDSTPGTLSTACTKLFSAVKPAGQTDAPADTLQAALDMALNPTNVGTSTTPPFSLSSSIGPFQPSLSAVPTDYTLGLNYGSTTLMSDAGSQNYFLYGAYALAIDSKGNIYNLNGPNAPTASPFDGISAITPGGVPYASFNGGTGFSARTMAIDNNDNVWSPSTTATTATLYEFIHGATTKTYNMSALGAQGIAIDGANDVFLGTTSASKILELASGASTFTTPISDAGTHLSTLAFDADLNLWSPANSGTDGTYKFAPTCMPTCTAISSPTYTTAPTSYTAASVPYVVVIDKTNVPWTIEGVSTATVNVTELNLSTPTSNGTTTSPTTLGGIREPQWLAMDGASNLWVTNYSPTSSPAATISEIAAGSTTVALSPANGFTHTYDDPKGIAVDQAGNVWIGNAGATNGTGAAAYSLTEIVGAGVPAVQPLAKAVALGKIGQAP